MVATAGLADDQDTPLAGAIVLPRLSVKSAATFRLPPTSSPTRAGPP